MSINVRAVLGLIDAAVEALTDGGNGSQTVDSKGALWTRDYQAQPGQTGVQITPAGTPHGLTFRALRYDGTGNGTMTFSLVGPSSTATAQVWNLQPGEIVPMSSAAIPLISAVTTGTLWALG